MPKLSKEEELIRVANMRIKEDELIAKGCELVCGIDEAGRGPLAGPVFAAAVILKKGEIIEGINDSKKLSPQKREALYEVIKEKALSFSFASVDENVIDEINILNATMLAMKNAVRGLEVTPDYALVDGNKLPELPVPSEAIVKGDSKSISIAAASIVAKVERDRFITNAALLYPEYGFEKHKGYGTREHIDAILKYGPCPIHRKTFLKKITGGKE